MAHSQQRLQPGRYPALRIGPWLLALLLSIASSPAISMCLPPPSAELLALASMTLRDPNVALRAIDTELRAPARADASPDRTTWLYSIKADAYWQLSDSISFAETTAQGLALQPDPSSALYVQLLIQDVYRDFRTETFKSAIPLLEQARSRFSAGSPEDVCLQSTLGDVYRLAGDALSAAPLLIKAYRGALEPGYERQRIYAAYALALFMRSAGDYERALSLLDERTRWDESNGNAFRLNSNYHMTGRFQNQAGKPEAALHNIGKAKVLAKQFNDILSLPFYELEECSILIQLQQLDAAEAICQSVARAFVVNEPAIVVDVEVLLADIALRRKHFPEALALLDRTLLPEAVKSSSFPEAKARLLRAHAYSNLGQPALAYADLEKHLALRQGQSDAERGRYHIAAEAEAEIERELGAARLLREQLQQLETRADLEKNRSQLILLISVISTLSAIIVAGVLLLRRRSLSRMARTDELTGLPNRRSAQAMLQEALVHARQTGTALTVALLDLDHFKTVNDTFGHAAGDNVLRRFASTARTRLRHSDRIGRWGGEEFLLIFAGSTSEDAGALIERLQQATADIRLDDPPKAGIPFSAGVSQLRGDGQSAETLVNEADSALYAAKHAGRGSYRIWDSSLQTTSSPPVQERRKAGDGPPAVGRSKVI